MRHFTLLGSLAVTLLTAFHLSAKPKSMAVDTTFDDCGWAAEVKIVEVGEAIRVRVSEDADRIFRGHELLGKVVNVLPVEGGDASCKGDLLPLAGTRATLLMVVNREGRVQLVGTPQSVDDSAGYHLQTWYDFNAIWFYSSDKTFGQTIGDAFEGRYAVTQKQVAARFAKERKRLMSALAAILLRPRVELPEETLRKTIAELGDDEFYVREAAQRQLLTLDAGAVDFLQEQARQAADLEISNRLGQIVRAIQSPLELHARSIRKRGAGHEARVLLEAYDATNDERMRAAIASRLVTLAGEASIAVTTFSATLDDIVAAWRESLD